MKELNYKLETIYFYYTSCNFKCRHCWIDPEFMKDSGEIPLSVIKRAIKEAKKIGLKGIKLTGGEPFLMKNILELLYWLKNEELSIIIETNGSLIEKEVAKVIKETEVSQVSVSLDSTDSQVHDYIRGIPGAFEQTIRGINYLQEYGVRTQIITSLISKNSEELPDIVNFASKLGADSLKINPVIPMGRGENMQKRGELLDVEKILEVYKKLKESFNNNFPLKVHFDIPPVFKSLNDLTDDFGTCKIHNILGILSNGMVSICGIGKNITQLVMGNIEKDSIIDIWENSKILKELRETIPHKILGVCSKCMFKNYCNGKCAAETYYLTGTFNAPFRFCDEAYKKGLFPKTRLVEK